jgi:PBP1b-binding outer membrane lipoprotein LpoB
MKKVMFYLNAAAVIILLSGCSSSISQQNSVPEEVYQVTDSFIIEKTGEQFFNSYIKASASESKADSIYYNVIYRFIIAELDIDKEIVIIVNQSGNIVNDPVPGLPDCRKDTTSCQFNINESEAKKIAEDNGLSKGIKEWMTDFQWQPEYERYIWNISSVLNESEGTHGYRGNGEVILIDPSSGMVLDKSTWFIR